MIRRLWLWAPVLAWMTVIFGFSAQSSVPGGAEIPDWLTHGSAYGILGGLLARALCGGLGRRLSAAQALLAVALATAYGVSDEYHQAFVPERQSDPFDVLKDFCGATLGAVLVRELGRRATGRGDQSA